MTTVLGIDVLHAVILRMQALLLRVQMLVFAGRLGLRLLTGGSQRASQTSPAVYCPKQHAPPPQHRKPVVFRSATPFQPLEDNLFCENVDCQQQDSSGKTTG